MENNEISRERWALTLLKKHFNSVNEYPAEEKISVAMLIIESGLRQDQPDYSKQRSLDFN